MGEVEEFAFVGGVDAGSPFGEKTFPWFARSLMIIAVDDGFVAEGGLELEPVGEARIFEEVTGVMVIGDDEERAVGHAE